MGAARDADLPDAVARLDDGEHHDVDERRRRRVADEHADAVTGHGRARADGLDAAGVPARAGQRRAGRHPRSQALSRRHAVLGFGHGDAAVPGHALGRDRSGAAARARVPERRGAGDALARVFGDRAQPGAARAASRGARAERRGDERLAHHRPDRRRLPDLERGHRVRVRAQRDAVARRGAGDPALEDREEDERAAGRALPRRDPRRGAVRAPVRPDALRADARGDLLQPVDRADRAAAAARASHRQRLGSHVHAAARGDGRRRDRVGLRAAESAHEHHARRPAAPRLARAGADDGGRRLRTEPLGGRAGDDALRRRVADRGQLAFGVGAARAARLGARAACRSTRSR